MKEIIAGVDIGGTKIAVALEDARRREKIAARRIAMDVNLAAEAMIDRLFAAIDEMTADGGGAAAKIVSIGIGCPSPLDVERGLVKSPSNLRHWDRFPIVERFRAKFGGAAVRLENDANAAALGEYVDGAGRGFADILYVTVSTGIGGGIILGGEIYRGVAAAAGEIGHTIVDPDGERCNCGSIGCLETIAAGVHIARRARARLAAGEPSIISELAAAAGEDVSAKTVLDAAARGDALALEIWREICRALALGIGNAVSLLAPEAVVVGGGIAAAAGDRLLGPLREMVPSYVSMVPKDKIKITAAALGGESGVHGALALARAAASNSRQNYA